MSEQAVAVVGGDLEVADQGAILQPQASALKEAADALVLRAQVVEVLGSDRVVQKAIALMGEIGKFLKRCEQQMRDDIEPFDTAVNRIKTEAAELVKGATTEKNRLQGLLARYADQKRREADEAARKQREETARLQREARALEEEKRKAAEALANAATEEARKEQQQKARELALRTAELNQQVAEVSKVVEAPKIEGAATQTKWTFKILGDTPAEQAESMKQAFLVHPEWFKLDARVRVIEAAVKAVEGKIECAGLSFYQETSVRPR